MLTRRKTKKLNESDLNASGYRSCDEPECGEPDCDLRRVIKALRTKKKPKKIRKLDDTLLSLIYLVLYMLAFYLFIEVTVGVGFRHIDNEATYLPLDLNSQHLYLEAVQRSRMYRKIRSPAKKIQFEKLKKRIKYSLLNCYSRSKLDFK
jgi:hypothetical protein